MRFIASWLRRYLTRCGWIICLGFGLVTPCLAQSFNLSPPELLTDRQGLPQSFIPSIVQDQQGFIWMATRDGLARYDGHTFKVFQPQANLRPSLAFAGLRSIQMDTHGNLWILSEQNDIDRFDPRTETFVNISRLPIYHKLLAQKNITTFLIDRQNQLWIAFEEKELPRNRQIGRINTHSQQYHLFQLSPSSQLSRFVPIDIKQDQKGRIWVVTSGHLHQIDEPRGQERLGSPLESAMKTVGENKINSLYVAPNGELLIGTERNLFAFNPTRGTLRHYPLLADRDDTWYDHFAHDSQGRVYFSHRQHLYRYVSGQAPQPIDQFTTEPGRCLSLLVDRSDVLWFGTDGLGIRKYDLRAYPFERAVYQQKFLTDLLTRWLHVPASQASPVRTKNPYQFRYTLDHKGRLWVTVGSSLFFQIKSGPQQPIILPGPNTLSPSYRWEVPLTTDDAGRVWALAKGNQLWQYDESQPHWKQIFLPLDPHRTGTILELTADRQAFWLATESNGLFRLDRQTGQLRQFVHQPADSTSLSSNALLCLSADPTNANRLWVGTFGSGLCAFDKRTGRSHRLTTANGLPNNVIYSALPDGQGYLWMGTNKGLCRLDRQTFQTRTYTHQDGLLADEFNRFHYVQLPGPVRRSDGTADGKIVMAGLEGFTAFYPDQLVDDRFEPVVELTSLQINNTLITTRPDSPLHGLPIQAVRQIDLPYNQNFVTVGFAAMQFNRPQANHYRYRLEGLETRWVETAQPQAVYTDLRPSQYTLLVNASNTSGQWSRFVRKLTITVYPPLWATWWAYVLYTLIGGTLIGFGIRAYLNRLSLEQTADWQHKEAQQLRLINEMKSRFFANITHEFRTPLSLILTPAQQLRSTLEDATQHRWVGTIERNAQQLLRLINQLMDLSKLDARAMPIDESQGELSEFIHQCVEGFREQAEAKGLQLRYEADVTGIYWYDAGKLEQILVNLVSNALKFTPGVVTTDRSVATVVMPETGQILVQLSATDGGVTLIVSDTGIGIPATKLPSIFDRFYQVTTTPIDGQEGTGIGLALVQELVNLQNGQISVQSQEGSQTRSGWTRSGWTRFTVQLPYRRASVLASPDTQFTPRPFTEAPSLESVNTSAGESATILVVEDNPELAEFIAESLPSPYQIIRASNGQQGIALAVEWLPDLVISDVMMPIMDGYTLCQTLKTDLRTSHIPLILLTAKSAHQSRMQGLALGADDYLTKPFHVPELQLRVRNLLEQRARLRAWMHQSLLSPQAPVKATERVDPFLEKVYDLLEAHLDEPTYGVDELAADLAMSRPTLYRKCTSVVNLAPSDLIQNYRLKRATELLVQGYGSTETAYRVGFNTPTYFAKRFKEFYGLSPSEYSSKSL